MQAGHERATMNDLPPQNPGGFTPAKFIAVGVVLTIAIILGIKYFISSGPGGTLEDSQPAGGAADPFRTETKDSAPPGYNPARRAESLGGGGSIEMFEKTNAGYAKEEEEENSEEAAETAAAEAKKTAAPATAAAAGSAAKKPASTGTVIPKLQPVRGFAGSSGSEKTALPKGAATPDISAIIQGVQKDTAKKMKNNGR